MGWQDENLAGQGSGGSQWGLWAVAGVIGLCVVGACLVGGYFAARPVLQRPTRPPPPSIPTVTNGAGTAVVVGDVPPTLVATSTRVGAPTVTLPAGRITATPLPAPGRELAASRLNTAPLIDGNLSEWTSQPSYISAFRVYNLASWDGSEDVVGSWQLGWDTTYLYVAVTVVDNIHVQIRSGNLSYQGDSLEMQIDTNVAANATLANPNTFQFILSPGNFGSLPPSAFRFQGDVEGNIPDAPGHGVLVAAVPQSDGYTLEARIPWSDLNYVPGVGQSLGVALNVNDNDTPGTAAQEVMMSHVSTRTLRNPSTWGVLRLE